MSLSVGSFAVVANPVPVMMRAIAKAINQKLIMTLPLGKLGLSAEVELAFFILKMRMAVAHDTACTFSGYSIANGGLCSGTTKQRSNA